MTGNEGPFRPDAAGPAGLDVDVCVVGASVAGACLAHRLRACGVRFALVDTRRTCLPAFRVEKLGESQFAYLVKFGLMDRLESVASRIGRIEVGRRGRIVETEWSVEYGFHYHDLVNALRDGLDIEVGHVTNIALAESTQRVLLRDGRPITARLVVLASGGSMSLPERLGIARRHVHDDHSMSFGFMIRTASGRLPYDELTYHPERFRDLVDYITIFSVPDGIRANLFTYHHAKAPIVRAMRADPDREMARLFPRLPRLIGPYEVVGKVEAVPMDIWVSQPRGRPGLAVIGDAYQSACPSTGIGCTKALNDVDVLSTLIPGWLATPGMGAAKVDALYEHPRKCAIDSQALTAAGFLRRFRTDNGLRMRLHRARQDLLMSWRGYRQRASRRVP